MGQLPVDCQQHLLHFLVWDLRRTRPPYNQVDYPGNQVQWECRSLSKSRRIDHIRSTRAARSVLMQRCRARKHSMLSQPEKIDQSSPMSLVLLMRKFSYRFHSTTLTHDQTIRQPPRPPSRLQLAPTLAPRRRPHPRRPLYKDYGVAPHTLTHLTISQPRLDYSPGRLVAQ